MEKLPIMIIALLVFFMVGFNACTSNPVLVEVPGAPIDTTGTDTIIVLVEENLCNNEISFERQILPLVVASCAYSGCHDTETAEEDVILVDYNSIMNEVDPYNPGNSSLYQSITLDPNDNEFMPPPPAIALNTEQINLIKDWIDQGAKNTACNIPCESEKASFADDVMPIIEMHCLGCHQPTNALGSVNLIDHAHIRTFAITGQLMGSIKYVAGYVPMPETSLKMTDCQIATIQNWITEGALNN